MNTRESYNLWASQYDTNENKTRDLEANALRTTLATIHFERCLEIGCGTGKNTSWLLEKAKHVTAVDLSEEMLKRARTKITSPSVDFKLADITSSWSFTEDGYDLVTFSLVLEHIQNLDSVFYEASKKLHPGGYVYVGELHPFKQYTGTKARFEINNDIHVVSCFDHHVSDFISSAKKNGLELVYLDEYFDGADREGLPRILVLLLRKVNPLG